MVCYRILRVRHKSTIIIPNNTLFKKFLLPLQPKKLKSDEKTAFTAPKSGGGVP
jgi:hypothetical protein